MEAVILAGGLGTRLSSRLHDIPKPMAQVGGRPFLAFLLDRLVLAGCGTAILSVGHLRKAITDAFQDNYRGMHIRYIVEETPLGTGGAIRLALSQVIEQSVLVLNGDTYLDLDLGAITLHHGGAGRPITMAVTQVQDISRYGGVLVQNCLVTGFVEKGRNGPGWINAGMYVLDKKFPWPDNLPPQFSLETDVLSAHIGQIRPSAFSHAGYFLDIGVPQDLDRAQAELGSNRDHIR